MPDEFISPEDFSRHRVATFRGKGSLRDWLRACPGESREFVNREAIPIGKVTKKKYLL